MSDNRKYYYLKLKESYFDDDAIVLLESMQDGMLYSNILLKLYLKSLKYGGTLQLDENIPYTAQMIATITRQQVGTVERALQIFMKLGLVEPLDNGALYMSNIELFIGQSSTEGERKRRARMKISEQKRLSGQVSEAKADICPPEIEIKKEIDMEKEISVRMTNFALILNDLAATFEGKNEYISNLCRYPLLILDDFGMERGTEYGLEQVYNVIDSRYRSGKPLIVTTNLTLTELQNPQDTPHARIYDRLLEMCAPVCFSGENFRRESAQNKLNRLKQLMND